MTELETKGGNLENEPVRRVRQALAAGGYGDRVIELADTARSAREAADTLGVELGAIVKSLVFTVGKTPVMALVAGDHRCLEENLPRALNLEGEVGRLDADTVKLVTGFSIGGVAPVGMTRLLPTVIDRSFKRFDTVYAAAGHPHCVFPASVTDLKRLTRGIVSYNIAAPAEH
ncbi:MAG: YbaK/EbsC family protein [Rhodospirillales bacterium]